MSENYFQQRMDYLKSKFKIKNGKIQLEGQALTKDDGRPLSEVVQELERDRQKGFKLSVASVPFQGRKVKLWYDVKI